MGSLKGSPRFPASSTCRYCFYTMALMIYDDLSFIIWACSGPRVFDLTAKQDTNDVTHLCHSWNEIAQNHWRADGVLFLQDVIKDRGATKSTWRLVVSHKTPSEQNQSNIVKKKHVTSCVNQTSYLLDILTCGLPFQKACNLTGFNCLDFITIFSL